MLLLNSGKAPGSSVLLQRREGCRAEAAVQEAGTWVYGHTGRQSGQHMRQDVVWDEVALAGVALPGGCFTYAAVLHIDRVDIDGSQLSSSWWHTSVSSKTLGAALSCSPLAKTQACGVVHRDLNR